MVVVILMGVCGCGKTTVGEALAARVLFLSAIEGASLKEIVTKMWKWLIYPRLAFPYTLSKVKSKGKLRDLQHLLDTMYEATRQKHPDATLVQLDALKAVLNRANHQSGELLGCLFSDADDFHSDENKLKMRSSIPLTDEDRLPWLRKIYEYIKSLDSKSQTCVVTCSALKKKYRDILRSGAAASIPQPNDPQQQTLQDNTVSSQPALQSSSIVFVHLKGSKQLLEERLAGRIGHFMPADLLTSQLATLEEPGVDENCLAVDIAGDVPQIVDTIVRGLQTQ